MFDRFIVPFLASSMGVMISLAGFCFLGDPPSDPPWINPSGEPTSTWRQTADGWQDTSEWRVGKEESRVKFIDEIHPTVVAGLILLLCLGVGLYFDRKTTDDEDPGVKEIELPERL